jgi:hypothetical protein
MNHYASFIATPTTFVEYYLTSNYGGRYSTRTMEDIIGRIESEIKALQESHEQLKRQLEHNKRERLRKCREAGILDHWRRLQRDRAALQRTRNHTMMWHKDSETSADTGNQVVDRRPSYCQSGPYHNDVNIDANSYRSHEDEEAHHPPLQEANTTENMYISEQNFHNDYSQHFVDTNERPQNFIRSTSLVHRFSE